MQDGFDIGPARHGPAGVLAYAATRVGALAERWTGKYGFNSLRRCTADLLAAESLCARRDGEIFYFPALDGYCALLFLAKEYEPEIGSLLRLLRDVPYAFIDGGAHLGYWAVRVSGAGLGRHRCVAVEASASTFQLLERNCVANDRRFVALHAALYETTGALLRFDDGPERAARHLCEDETKGVAVVSVSVDDLAARFLPGDGPLVVKLDIEGAEPEALGGCTRVRRERDCLFVVEDHGADREHRTAAACLQEGLSLWLLGASGTATPLPDLAAVTRVKVRADLGYNLLAIDGDSPLGRQLGVTREALSEGRPLQLRLVPAARGAST